MSTRFNILQEWLHNQFNIHDVQLIAITNDASFRRYFRVMLNGVSHIVMDAPPEQENCLPFIDIAKRLQESGANVPKIVASNLEHGFLVLTDLGEQVYLPALAHQEQVEHLYQDALDALLLMQTHTATHNLPLYDHQLLHNEMDLFTHWLWGKHLNFPSPPDTVKPCFELLSHSALSQPQVFVHRDYHSRNLMCLPQNNPGILDFQDAVLGPITYDLVSLLRDCYISWPLKQVQGWALDYYAHAQHANLLKGIDQKQFLQWFDWMGIQRHLKASGIFARLYHRDGKSGYLKDIPRTLNYIVEVTAHYPELTPLHQVVKTTLNHLT